MQFGQNSNCFLTRRNPAALHALSIAYQCLAVQTFACALVFLEVQIQSFAFSAVCGVCT